MNGALTILDTGFAGFEISACEDNFQYRLNNRVNLIKDLCLDHVRVTIKKIALAEGYDFSIKCSQKCNFRCNLYFCEQLQAFVCLAVFWGSGDFT